MHRGRPTWQWASTIGPIFCQGDDAYARHLFTATAFERLCGVVVDDGILVFFVGEQPPLDSSQVGVTLNGPRDVGFVKVAKASRIFDR